MNSQRGSAMIIALIVLAIGTLILTAFLASTKTGTDFASFFRKKTSLRLEAESGWELAKNDILERSQNTSFIDVDVDGTPDQDAVEAQGLVYDAERASITPRYNLDRGKNIQLRVFYFPSRDNGTYDLDYDKVFPKYFHVVSEAQNRSTGQTYTFEGYLQIRLESFAEYSFGMMSPDLPDGVTDFIINPSTYSGHVHFGAEANGIRPRFIGTGWSRPIHQFNGPVTFENGPGSNGLPFTFQQGMIDLKFEKGFRTPFPLHVDPEKEFDKIADIATTTIPGSPGQKVCLKFVPREFTGTTSGEVWQYTCNDVFDALQRYVGEAADPTHYPTPIHKMPASGVIYSLADLEVKGIVDGNFTVASEGRIVLGGDIQYRDQDPHNSSDMFGAVAKGDLFIPYGVPWGRTKEWYTNTAQGNQTTKPENDITNFVLPNDRDEIEYREKRIDAAIPDPSFVEYPHAWGNPANDSGRYPGWQNGVASLDLDGHFVSLGGKLNVQGYNEYDPVTGNPATGMMIPAVDGNVYTLDLNKPNSFYINDPVTGAPTRVAEPMYGGEWRGYSALDGRVMLYREVVRPSTERIQIFGGLVVNNFSNTGGCNRTAIYSDQNLSGGAGLIPVAWNQGTFVGWDRECGGFNRRSIRYDERLALSPPPGFPETPARVLEIFWTKETMGESPLVPTPPPN